MSSIINDEKKEFVSEFVNSSRELLDDVEPQIMALEKSSTAYGEVDPEILNTIFRLFHTLKGTASFVDLQTITSVTHEAETLLDIFRKEKINLQTEHVDLLCRTNDFIRNILDTVEKQLDDKGFEDVASGIVIDLKNTIAAVSGEAGAEKLSPGNFSGNSVPQIKPAAAASEDTQQNAQEPETEEAELEQELKLVITPEMQKRFTQESHELCEEAELMLLAFERVPDNLELAANAFRALHSIKGNAGFFGFAELEKVSHAAETILDSLRSGAKKPDKNIMSAILSAIDFIRNGAKKVADGLRIDAAETARLTEVLNSISGESLGSGPNQSRPEGQDSSSTGNAGESSKQSEAQSADGAQKSVSAATSQQYIRIDTEKLDMLLDLVGEMVIAESMVANSPDLRGLQLEKFDKAIHHLNKITRDIQETALAMRMIPLSSTFHKMERLVRDLSNKFNKKIKLEIAGEETEVDKTIIEQISDPLVHIIRNSMDHGLESNEERIAAGKPPVGTVRLEAKHSAGEVWIIIEDDGRGLNREKIIKKAIENSLIRGDGSDMKDEEVWKLIFEPGFSTAEKVSNISGRGVGMDVVKRNIEKLRGRVDIRTQKNAGTMIILRIPLTLAIIDGMEIQVGRARYIIPISSIRQSFKTTPDKITHTPDGTEVVNVRGELLPVIRLHKMYNINSLYTKLEEGLLIIVENNEKKCCLFVDELIGQQQIVIKGLSNYLGHVRGVSGCAIMGDGEISLILDIGDLINSVEMVTA
ncbi:MAG TPA: chemotaxis protein CheA [Candidatus Wallbacteria bacterium]|nr:MAG: Chemotaxis protein CheA [bacterium ADurb.Bin243]HPG56272.1 chemotaxis protein CheA [Candidatus Wallbacteria bacterium]